jgi:23S rRNA pseudouridine2605 synthase
MTNSNNRKSRDDKSSAGKRTGERTERSGSRRPSSNNSERPKKFDDYKEGKRSEYGDKKDFQSKSGRPAKNNFNDKPGSFKKSFEKRDDKPWEKNDRGFKKEGFSGDRRNSGERGAFGDRTERGFKKEGFSNDKRSFNDRNAGGEKRSYVKKDNYAQDGASKFADRKDNRYGDSRPFRKREEGAYKGKTENRDERAKPNLRARKVTKEDDNLIRLNRYIANSGICSRRKADELIEAGVVSVNGVAITELGHKVDPYKDQVRYNGELLKREKKVYVLLNKPKDYITTTEDPQERKTVMHLVEKASRERIYPVGRLDRNTTGLILMTNDGDLADKLSHPRHGITKIYQVELSRNLSQGDFNKIEFGLELEDGLIKPDNISYVTGGSKKEIGIQIHSGKNRIVRRIFEHLGYEVVKLDRVVYGNLTKKDLPRGKWRFLDEHELIQIKHLIK